MRKLGFLVVLGSLSVSLMGFFAATSFAQTASAQAFLQSIYATYQKTDKALDIGSQQKAARYFVPPVAKLIGEDTATSAKRNEVGKLDFDPFIGGQDWAPTRIDLTVLAGATTDRATGTARFTPPGEKEPTTVTLDLTKTAAGWRIADIHWARQADSLVAILTKPE
ncbi:MAG: DUF3828 domain-containing protein [Hyphomicrobiales bacterium]|nr:DUF3828 domain-containing protein [Hyphomicrobiales bacterium]MBV8824447.1 DUF3828 domain-containing protein [Hyphomicrobiales bacterium]MBV9426618.1 DUF3828 domain-containing protein [Bradyrhizobiaceae bacterium]